MVKNLKKLFLAILIATFSTGVFAQQIEEVTLTVWGDGATKEKATEVALRSAIEQAFGVFVSANTTILNDELVKDEIATVSSGNIKEYEEITAASLPDGNTTVTLKAVVSVSKLISYAQSKGSSAEFAGATFGMNMKLKELNKANEEKAVENMISQFRALAPSMFDYELELGEPRVSESDENYYEISAKVSAIPNENAKIVVDILFNTLKSLALSVEEIQSYKQTNVPIHDLIITEIHFINSISPVTGEERVGREILSNNKFIFRSIESRNLIMRFFNIEVYYDVFGFKIVDNLNGISMIDIGQNSDNHIYTKGGTGLLNSSRPSYYTPIQWDNGYIPFWLKNEYIIKNLVLTIPKDDIMKYNKFEITHK
jgi:hypothetical protein